MAVPFEYCALRYLLQWHWQEKPLHRSIKADPSPDEIRRALRYFQVARNFTGLGKKSNADAIRKALSRIGPVTASTFEDRVCEFASRLQMTFDRYPLSAASKLLWLRFRSPVIIYDARARQALRQMGGAIRDADYSAYCSVWRTMYARSRDQIGKAVARLVELRPFLPATVTDSELEAYAHQEWFRERVFDIYLWEQGSDD